MSVLDFFKNYYKEYSVEPRLKPVFEDLKIQQRKEMKKLIDWGNSEYPPTELFVSFGSPDGSSKSRDDVYFSVEVSCNCIHAEMSYSYADRTCMLMQFRTHLEDYGMCIPYNEEKYTALSKICLEKLYQAFPDRLETKAFTLIKPTISETKMDSSNVYKTMTAINNRYSAPYYL